MAERQLWELDVAGSNPVAPTISINYLRRKRVVGHKKDTTFERKGLQNAGRKGRMPSFPVNLPKGSKVVTIYEPTQAKPSYRVVFKINQKRHARYFKTYEEARKFADLKITQIAAGNNLGAGFSTAESQQFDLLRQSAKLRGVPPEKAIQDWIAAVDLLPSPDFLVEAARSFSAKQVVRKEISLREAVKDYLTYKKPFLRERTFSQEKLKLRRICEAFECNISQLSRAALREWVDTLRNPTTKRKVGPKTRNHYRGSLRTFLEWCVRNDYLESESNIFPILKSEKDLNNTSIAIYSPEDFQRLLDQSSGDLRVCVALSGLTGIRAAELQRLEWSDVTEEHLEVARDKAKTRSRRLIDITPTLRRMLPHPIPNEGLIWPWSPTEFGKQMRSLFLRAGVAKKDNAFRHSFISYRLALTSDENTTSREAGNSPEMIYKNYREVVSQKEAKKWFGVL